VKKDFLSFEGLTAREMREILELAREVKREPLRFRRALEGKTLGMIFQKSSTRTRISFEVGMYELGGLALYFRGTELQLGRGETVGDTARVLSRYIDGVMIRTFSDAEVEELAANATIPVINGLTDLLHPCQILADLFTIEEHFGKTDGIVVAYIGDGNNVLNSWLEAAAILPIELRFAVPEGYEPDEKILKRAVQSGVGRVIQEKVPGEAVRGAQVVYTDVWVSMGQEEERARRLEAFRDYRVTADLCVHASRDHIVMHCLPAHRGEEITDEVIDGSQSVVFTQAENRLHAQKALLVTLLGRG
jgi:ornithine carbamoyltransferase